MEKIYKSMVDACRDCIVETEEGRVGVFPGKGTAQLPYEYLDAIKRLSGYEEKLDYIEQLREEAAEYFAERARNGDLDDGDIIAGFDAYAENNNFEEEAEESFYNYVEESARSEYDPLDPINLEQRQSSFSRLPVDAFGKEFDGQFALKLQLIGSNYEYQSPIWLSPLQAEELGLKIDDSTRVFSLKSNDYNAIELINASEFERHRGFPDTLPEFLQTSSTAVAFLENSGSRDGYMSARQRLGAMVEEMGIELENAAVQFRKAFDPTDYSQPLVEKYDLALDYCEDSEKCMTPERGRDVALENRALLSVCKILVAAQLTLQHMRGERVAEGNGSFIESYYLRNDPKLNLDGSFAAVQLAGSLGLDVRQMAIEDTLYRGGDPFVKEIRHMVEGGEISGLAGDATDIFKAINKYDPIKAPEIAPLINLSHEKVELSKPNINVDLRQAMEARSSSEYTKENAELLKASAEPQKSKDAAKNKGVER